MIIACTAEWIREQILNNVRKAKSFSVYVDEAADCSNKEQLPLVLHFIDGTDYIREEFVDLMFCDTGTPVLP